MDEKRERCECDACGVEDDCVVFEDYDETTRGAETKVFRMCDYCHGSFAGNAARYPRQYPDGILLMAMAQMFHVLERRLS